MIESEEFSLRPLRKEEVDYIRPLLKLPELKSFFTITTTDEQFEKVIEDLMRGFHFSNFDTLSLCLVIYDKSKNTLVGIINGHYYTHNKHLLVGYAVFPEFQGNNIAFRASETFFNYLIPHLDPEYLFAHIHPDNAPSIHVIKKLGFIEEPDSNTNFYNFYRKKIKKEGPNDPSSEF